MQNFAIKMNKNSYILKYNNWSNVNERIQPWNEPPKASITSPHHTRKIKSQEGRNWVGDDGVSNKTFYTDTLAETSPRYVYVLSKRGQEMYNGE